MATVELRVITPSKLFYQGQIELVIVRTTTGDEGFMAGHSWAVKLIDIGKMCIREAGSQEFQVAAVSSGFIDVKDDIVIYVDAAEWSEDINMERAMNERESAQAFLDAHKDDQGTPPEYLAAARASVARSTLRLSVAGGTGRRS